jgi:non-ribosomal peptide synthetase component F
VQGLRRVGQQHQATLYMVVLAAWQALLARWSGQRDIVVGSPVGTRSHVELEGLIGCFLNMVVVRTPVDETLPMSALVEQVREQVLGAYAHQEVPFEAVVAAVQPTRAQDETPLVRVLFTWHNEPQGTLTLADVRWTRLPAPGQSSKFDLTLAVTDGTTGLAAALEYRPDLFEAATMQRLASQFQMLLATVAADSAQVIADIALLQEDEQEQLLQWSQVQNA